MGKKIKRLSLWFRRKSNIPLFLIGGAVIVLLFLNDDISLSLNMKYQKEINRLNKEIAQCKDSAEYYKGKREALLNENNDLEHIAREQYNMQRPSEDVFIIKE